MIRNWLSLSRPLEKLMRRQLIPLVLMLALVPVCHSTQDAAPSPGDHPRNVILFVGDGMGTTHFTVLHRIRGAESTLPRFTNAGLVTSHSASDIVTDSGAAATALATGVKTDNGALSVTPDGEPVETALELAEKSGRATGLVTTTGFWDATPAAFASHTPSRQNAEEIVRQILSSGVDLVISNGAEKFGVENRPTVEELAGEFGYTPIISAAGLTKRDGKVLALFPGNELDLDYEEAPLPVLTRFSIDQLSGDPDGFFLVVETEGTDTASHENETEAVLRSLRSLDEAVSIALDFARANGETLVLFTGDHETGAFEISPSGNGTDLKLDWFSKHHTGQALPVFAYGPGSEQFSGWHDNTDIGKTLKMMMAE